MPYKHFWAAELTGGGTGAADKIPTAVLEDKNAVFVPRLSDLQMYMYAVDDDLGGSESSPSVIQPDDESGNKRLALIGLTLPNTGLRLLDTNASNYINIKWNENDTGDRILNLLVQGADRTIDLYENLKVVDGQDIELHGSGGEKAQLALDTQNAERTLDMSANLTIASGSTITLTAEDLATSILMDNANFEVENTNGTQRNFKITSAKAGNTTLTFQENFNIGDGSDVTITAEDAAGTITLDNCSLEVEDTIGSGNTIKFIIGTDDASRTVTLSENLIIGDGFAGTFTFSAASKTATVEDNAVISQDYTPDASPKFTDIILSKTSGKGIKVDQATPTFGWRDLLGQIITKGVGASDPDWALYRGSLRQYKFADGHEHEAWFNYHIPHDYLVGTDLHVHVHWSQITVDTGGPGEPAAPGEVKWYFDFSYADGHGIPGGAADPFIAPLTQFVDQQGSTTQYGQMIAEVAISNDGGDATHLNRATFLPDGVIQLRIYRDNGDDTLDVEPFVHFTDIHYQSTNMATKNKAPDFYA